MARQIKGRLYKVTYTSTWKIFVECESKQDLFNFIADEVKRGYIVASVNEIEPNGSSPRVNVKSNHEFKKILRERMDEK